MDQALKKVMEMINEQEQCNSRLLKSHMRLKKNRPYNHWLKSQGHYLLVFFHLKRSEQIRFTCDMRLKPLLQLEGHYQNTPHS